MYCMYCMCWCCVGVMLVLCWCYVGVGVLVCWCVGVVLVCWCCVGVGVYWCVVVLIASDSENTIETLLKKLQTFRKALATEIAARCAFH